MCGRDGGEGEEEGIRTTGKMMTGDMTPTIMMEVNTQMCTDVQTYRHTDVQTHLSFRGGSENETNTYTHMHMHTPSHTRI